MSKTLTATDRKALIRLASSMEKGSEERRAILAGLSKTARTNWKVVNLSRSTLSKANAVRWMYMNKAGNFDSYIALRVPNQSDLWALSKGPRFSDRKFRNVDSAGLLKLWERLFGWVDESNGGTPGENESLHATGDGEALISTDELPDSRQWGNV